MSEMIIKKRRTQSPPSLLTIPNDKMIDRIERRRKAFACPDASLRDLLSPFDFRYVQWQQSSDDGPILESDVIFIRHLAIEAIKNRSEDFVRAAVKALTENTYFLKFHCTPDYHELLGKFLTISNFFAFKLGDYLNRSWYPFISCPTGQHCDYESTLALWRMQTSSRAFNPKAETKKILEPIFDVILNSNSRMAILKLLADFIDGLEQKFKPNTNYVILSYTSKLFLSDNNILSILEPQLRRAHHFAGQLEPRVLGVDYSQLEARYDVLLATSLLQVYLLILKYNSVVEENITTLEVFQQLYRFVMHLHKVSNECQSDLLANIELNETNTLEDRSLLATFLVDMVSFEDGNIFTILTKMLDMLPIDMAEEDDPMLTFVNLAWYRFIESIGADHSVIVDMIFTEMETSTLVLKFLLAYLKRPPPIENSSSIGEFMDGLFSSLESKQSKGLAVFSVEPLLKSWRRWKERGLKSTDMVIEELMQHLTTSISDMQVDFGN